MITLLRALAILPAVAVAAAMIPHDGTLLKCGSVSPEGPLLAIDGVVTGPFNRPNSMGSITKDDIYRFDVLCMDPIDSTFNRTHGWQLMSVWTKRGPAPRLHDALNLIRDAQDAHHARHGSYITRLEEIRLPESMKPLRITLVADTKGWLAHTTVPRLLSTCAMYDGVIAAPLPIGPRHIVC